MPERVTRWSSIVTRQTVIVALLIVSVAIALGVVVDAAAEAILQQEIKTRLTIVAASTEQMIERYVAQQHERIRLVASRTRLRQFLHDHLRAAVDEQLFAERTTAILTDARDNTADFQEVWCTDLDGVVVAATDMHAVGRNLSDDVDYQQGRNGSHLGRPRQQGGRTVAYLTTPAKTNAGTPLGVIIVVLDIKPLLKLIVGQKELTQQGEVLIGQRVNDEVLYLLPSQDGTTSTALADVPAMDAAIGGTRGVRRGVLGTIEVYRPLSFRRDERWGLVVSAPEAAAFAPIRSLRRALFLPLVGAFLAGTILAYLSARRFTKPLQRLTKQASAIAAGDLHAQLAVETRDEVGMLTRAFNQMANDLAQSYQTLEARVAERTAELRREQFLLNSLVENIPDPIFFKDRDGRFIRVNRRMADDVGVADPSDLVGKTDADAWAGELWEDTQADERHIIATGEPLINKEENPVSRDGREKWVLVTKLPMRDESDIIVGTFGIARDITPLKKHEQDLKRINAELERSNQELENFAYVASHDLRTPLRNIDSLSEWILQDCGEALPDESRQDLELLRQRVALMNRLLNDLLQYSRVGRAESEPELLDPEDVLQEVMDLLSPPEGFQLSIRGPLTHLWAPRTALRTVFQNLIDNAIKHHDRDEGTITVEAAEEDGYVHFSVHDDGPGIEARFHDRVFQIFQTLKRRDELDTSGMGLAIVKKTIEGHGGQIWLESEGDRGASFHFTWPAGGVG